MTVISGHHAGLYRSLQLLGDRLGWTLYTPVGLDWVENGVWRFGQNVPGLTLDLAQQYLVPHEGVWEEVRGTQYDWEELYITHDPEFPEVPILGVTIKRPGKYDLVIATLDDNQQGFARFAQAMGAQYVAQVGNTRQWVDWSLDPLAIVSSEVPIRGRGVYYHQEMDPIASAFVDPSLADRHVISSFVNCFPSIACAPLLDEARLLLPEFAVNVYGIDGPEGVVKPITRLASEMAFAGFGWHDKVHGDGFGHVLHGWAAIGRPLIGHGSHYAGKMGEVFWRDLITCVDLDLHPIDEAMNIIRDIAADPTRHAEMCRAIRSVYDAIDYDAEEQDIRALLRVPVPV